jgi:glutamate formiminotransferase
MKQILECVPNFSEGRDLEKLNKILDCFRNKKGVILLDYSPDSDHNRCVVTVVGEPQPLKKAVIEAVGVAAETIDLRTHKGQHPRMGATDVVPFIPIQNVTEQEAVDISKAVAKAIWEQFQVPAFLYEKSASAPHKENLANIRKGEFEGLTDKMQQDEWRADFGFDKPHESAGATVVGARMPLVAFNVNIDTQNLEPADKTAKKVRFIGGGLRYVKALGIDLSERKMTQISMNLTDFTRTSIYFTYELIKAELKRYGATVSGTEIVGLVPYQALYAVAEWRLLSDGKTQEQINKISQSEIIQTAENYLKIENFKHDQVLEIKIAQETQK